VIEDIKTASANKGLFLEDNVLSMKMVINKRDKLLKFYLVEEIMKKEEQN